jgi:hypothetical protein
MARQSTASTVTPTFTGTLQDLIDTQPRYGMTLYKDGLYCVVHGVEEHYKRLKKGWSEEADEDVNYIPETATPEYIETARKQYETLQAKKKQAVESKTMITIEEARQLVKEAVAEALAS